MCDVLTTPGIPILLTFITVCLVAWLSTRRPPHIPPGPTLLPFIGNLYLIYNADRRKVFRNLRGKYGDIFSLYIGNKLVVVLNGFDTIKEALVRNGDVFSDRPPDARIIDGQTRGIITTSGPLWKEHRTFALNTLRNFGFGRSKLETKIQSEIHTCLDEIANRGKNSFDGRKIIQCSISNVICSIVFDQRFHYEDPVFIDLIKKLDAAVQQSKVGPFQMLLKFLKYLPGDLGARKLGEATLAKSNAFSQKIYKEHVDTYDENNIRDYIDAFIQQMGRQNTSGTTFTESQLYGEIFDLFAAGSETTTSAILWAILHLINHPDVQNKMRSEIIDVIGIERRPSMQDKTKLPYSEAVITEILRLGNILPTSVPHYTSKDITWNGFHIPKSTTIIPNLDSVLGDATVWENPEEFFPERFLNETGSVKKYKEFMPFSAGRRVCLGESLARMELFLFLTSLIQRFVFLPPDNGLKMSTEGIVGITHSPRPYKLRVQDLLCD